MLRDVRLLTVFNFLLDFRPYAPVVILYFREVTGSFALGLGIYSIATISAALLEIPTGLFSDMVGRKKTILLGALSSALGVAVWAIGGSFWMLALGAVLEGLAQALFSGNNDALLHDTLKEAKQENRFSEFLGKTGAMFQVGLATSAILGGYLTLWSYQTVLAISVIPHVLGFILALFIVEPKIHSEEIKTNIFGNLKIAFSEFLQNARLRNVSLASVLGHGIGETMFQFGPVFIASLWAPWALGIARFLSHASSALGYWFAGAVIKNLGATKTAFYGSFAGRIFGIFAVGFPTIASPVLLSVGFHGLNQVSKGTLLQKEFTDRQRATMASLNSFLGSLFFGVFAFSFGYFADNIGPRNALLIGEFLLLIPSLIFWRVLRMK